MKRGTLFVPVVNAWDRFHIELNVQSARNHFDSLSKYINTSLIILKKKIRKLRWGDPAVLNIPLKIT